MCAYSDVNGQVIETQNYGEKSKKLPSFKVNMVEKWGTFGSLGASLLRGYEAMPLGTLASCRGILHYSTTPHFPHP